MSFAFHLNAVSSTEVFDAKEHCEVVALNTSNAFVLTEAKNLRADPDKRVVMVVEGALAKMLLFTLSNTHKDHVIHKQEIPVIHS